MVGVGVGTAAAAAIDPLIEPGRQQAWQNAANRVLDPDLYARLVAQGGIELGVESDIKPGTAYDYAQRNGVSPSQLRGLVYLAQRAPDLALTLELWRRGKFGTPTDPAAVAYVDHALAKAQIEPRYWTPLKDLFYDRLSPPVLALAIVRGIVKDPGFLPVQPPTGVGKVPAFPVSSIDALTEALAGGFDAERLFVETAIAGRPPGPELMARAAFRQIIDLVDYERAISEGDVRNEWREAIFEVSREILTANQYAELELRGFLNDVQRQAKTDQHGMSAEDSQLLVDLLGRSIAVHGVTTGLARGGKYPGSYANVPEPYKSAIQRSNIREEWAELAYANRYTYPSAFVLRALAQAGELGDTAAVQQVLLDIGWPPNLAATVAASWTANTTAAKDPYIGKAETQLWTATHKAYKDGAIDAVQAENLLGLLIDVPGDVQQVLYLWDAEKTLAVPSGPIT